MSWRLFGRTIFSPFRIIPFAVMVSSGSTFWKRWTSFDSVFAIQVDPWLMSVAIFVRVGSFLVACAIVPMPMQPMIGVV